MDNQGESQKVLWYGARTWCLVIGWVETIVSAISLLFMIISCFVVNDFNKADLSIHLGHEMSLAFKYWSLHLISMLIEMVAGIFLIQIVNQQSVRKMKIWTVIQFVQFVLAILGAIADVQDYISAQISFFALISLCIYHRITEILIRFLCMILVNLHKQELITGRNSGAQVKDKSKD